MIYLSTINGINEGIRSLPEIMQDKFTGWLVEGFRYIYGLSYWTEAFYGTYQTCCGVATQDKTRTGKIIIAIILYVFLTILASVIL